jgi:hypothetical protein
MPNLKNEQLKLGIFKHDPAEIAKNLLRKSVPVSKNLKSFDHPAPLSRPSTSNFIKSPKSEFFNFTVLNSDLQRTQTNQIQNSSFLPVEEIKHTKFNSLCL